MTGPAADSGASGWIRLALIFLLTALASGSVSTAPTTAAFNTHPLVPSAYSYDAGSRVSPPTPVRLVSTEFTVAATSTRPVPANAQTPSIAASGFAAEAGAGADNVVNGLRLGQQISRESAESVFTSSGGLQQEVIDGSSRIIPGSNINNAGVIKELTADGSNIADWGKYTSRTFQSPSGPFQVHYCYNPSTGAVNYGYDYKVVFNGAR